MKANPVVVSYWLFCGSPLQDYLGYNDARKQHQAELKACRLGPEFQPLQRQVKRNPQRIVTELIFRLESLASWIEAQESWLFWTGLLEHPAAWDRDDPQGQGPSTGCRNHRNDAVNLRRFIRFRDRADD